MSPPRPLPRAPAVVVGGRRRADLLDRVLRPLTLLVAPAGAGKTALLAYWASRARVVPLWFDGGEARDRAALRQLLGGGPVGPVVVVDDAQGLTTAEWEPLVRAVRSGGTRVVLASRRDLPLPVVALELSGRLRILRGDHLRLTAAETRELVTTHAPDAATEDMDAVARRANGWAAAVILGAHALASAADRDSARAALIATDQPVLDYLLDEVFSTLPASTRHVLLCTADQDRVTAEAARVLSGDPTAPACLAQLAVEGMFVASYDSVGPHGGPEPAWVYHPLLLELLHRQTAPGRPDARLAAAAHARAAVHYEATDDPVDALRHAVASRRPALVADLLVRHCPRLLAAGQRPAVEQAIAAVPGELRSRDRALLVVAALERRAAGEVESVLRIVGELPAAADRPVSVVAPALAALVDADEAALRLWLTRTGFGDAQVAAADVLRWLRQPVLGGAQALTLDPARLAGLVVDLAYAVLAAGDLEAAAAHARRGAVLSAAAGSARLAAAAESVTAVVELAAARFQTAAAVAARALARLDGPALDEAATGRAPDRITEEVTLQAVLGWAAWYAADAGAARRQLDLARQALIPGADPVGAALLRQLAARVLAVEGDLAVAQRVVASDTELAAGPTFLRAMLEMLRGELALIAGDSAAAAVHTEALRGFGWDAERRLLSARLALREGRAESVDALLAPVLHPSAGHAPRAEASAAAAVAFELVRDVDATPPEDLDDDVLRDRLRDVLSRAAPQRRIRLFAPGSDSPGFVRLLREEAQADGGHPFARDVLDALLRSASPQVPLQKVPVVGTVGGAGAGPAESGRTPAVHVRTPAQRAGRRGGSLATVKGAGAVGAAPAASDPPVVSRGVPGPQPARPLRSVPPVPAGSPAAPVPPLTLRELDVLNRLARGDEYVDIAQHLYITQNTVKTHIASLYRKLNASRRSEALRTAWALGLLTEVAPPQAPPPAGDAAP